MEDFGFLILVQLGYMSFWDFGYYTFYNFLQLFFLPNQKPKLSIVKYMSS